MSTVKETRLDHVMIAFDVNTGAVRGAHQAMITGYFVDGVLDPSSAGAPNALPLAADAIEALMPDSAALVASNASLTDALAASDTARRADAAELAALRAERAALLAQAAEANALRNQAVTMNQALTADKAAMQDQITALLDRLAAAEAQAGTATN